MSVQTEIDRIITAVQAAHEKVAEKGGITAQPYLVANLASAIDSIPDASDPVLQEKTVTPKTSAQSVTPDSGYDGLSQVTVNAMPTATQATPSISVSSAGKITATATQTAGYVASGTKTGTKQLTTQAAQTITPSTSDKTIASGRYLTGTQTIKGDTNLVAGNIKKGVSIFGVSGSYEGGGGGANVATGTFTLSSAITTDGAEVVTISGLPFKPTYVIFHGANLPIVAFSGRRDHFIVLAGWRSPQYVGAVTVTITATMLLKDDSFAKITFTEDGFSINANGVSNTEHTPYYPPGTYSYVAAG